MRLLPAALAVLLAIAALSSHLPAQASSPGAVPAITKQRAAQVNAALASIIKQHGIITAGAAVIEDGRIAWTGYYGEQSPGVPASGDTLFNVASITKVVTTETVLRLVDDGRISLDEPMHEHWVDPDIRNDPRHRELTPRMALNHTTGFPNWRFFLEDNKLRFLNDPGTTYGYSGEGFEYLARFVEEKLGGDFGEIVREQTLDPIGMQDTAFSIRESTLDRIARPEDTDGTFHGHYCRPNGWCREPGSYSAADDMVTSVEDFAHFLVSVVDADGYGDELAAERDRVQTPKGDQRAVFCDAVPESQCPKEQGYGLGWEVLDYGDYKLISHGGSDWAEAALAYIYTGSRDGVVILFNAPGRRAIAAMPGAIEALHPASPLLDLYRRRAAASAGKAD